MFRLLGKDQINMPSLSVTIRKEGVNANTDAFYPTAEQRAYVVNTYINTGKMLEEKSAAGPAPGQPTSMTLTLKFANAEAMQEYIADPQIQTIKAQADAFYAAQGLAAERSAVFN
jgi:hypothetical protein